METEESRATDKSHLTEAREARAVILQAESHRKNRVEKNRQIRLNSYVKVTESGEN
jgi:hypothetical protein